MKSKILSLFATVFAAGALSLQATTYNVATTADGTGTSPLTLREALLEAQGGSASSPNIVNVPPGTYNLTSGALVYGSAAGQYVIIQGTSGSPANTIINQNGTDRVLNINPNVYVNVSVAVVNLTLTGGDSVKDTYGGGAITAGTGSENSGNILSLTNCVLVGNSNGKGSGVGEDGGGGGAVTMASGTLNAVNCVFGNNADLYGGAGHGGAIFYDCWGTTESMYLSGCIFTNNTASIYGGAIHILPDVNGNQPGGSVTITNCFFGWNKVTSTDVNSFGPAYGIGGAIYELGDSSFGPLNILSCTFATNSCTASASAGGAIYLYGSGGSATTSAIHDCRFIGNSVVEQSAGLPQGNSIVVDNTDATIPFSATDNWWGANNGPATGQVVTRTGSTTFVNNPPANYLVLNLTASSTNFLVNSTGSYALNLLTDSAGNAVPPANLATFIEAPVTGASTINTFVPAGFTSAGTAVGVLTPAGPGSGTITLTLDNQSLSTNVTVLPVAQPQVQSVSLVNATPTNLASVQWLVTFNSTLTGVNAGDFQLVSSGLTGAPAITAVTASGTNWLVTASTGGGLGTLQLNVVTNTGISPGLTNLPFSGASYVIDLVPPTVTIGAPSATITSSTPVSFPVTYGDPYFAASTLASGNVTVNATGTAAAGSVGVTGSGTNWTVTLSGITGNGTLGISIAAGTAIDTAGNLAPAAGPSATFTVDNTPPTLMLGNLSQTYDGAAKSVSEVTAPSGLPVTLTYNGSATVPTNAGSYTVIGTVSYLTFTVNVTNTLVISPAAATLSFGSLSQTYDGTAKSATVTTTPTGLANAVTYNGLANAPTNAGSYTVIGTITDPNYTGNATNTLVISPATATVSFGSLSQTYDGTAESVTVTTTPTGLANAVTYSGLANAPTNAGSYTVIGTITDPNYTGNATNTLVISPATATVSFGSLSQTYDGTAESVTVTTTPTGLANAVTYSGLANAPTNAGSYTVIGTITDPNYTGGATNTLVINLATATVTLGNLTPTYDGTAKSVSVVTVPTGLTVNVTYDGSASAPTNAGSYTVIGLVADANYAGGATNTLVIAQAPQTITFGALPYVVFGDLPFTLTATATSGLPVSFSSDTPAVASVSGSTVTVGAAGSATLTASQAGNANYLAATNASQLLVVNPFQMGLSIQRGPVTNLVVSTAILTLIGNTNRSYTILCNSDITVPVTNWALLVTTNLPVSPLNVTVPVPATAPASLFYRLESVPQVP